MSNDIYSLIPTIMGDIGAIAKTNKNKDQGYSFRGIEDMYNAAHHVMVKYGVFCCPEVVGNEIESFEKESSVGKKVVWHHATLKVRHRFYAKDGSYVDAITMGEGLDNSDKAINKAMSGAMKYAFIELFSIPTKDIEDADRTTPEVARTVTLTKPDIDPETVKAFNEKVNDDMEYAKAAFGTAIDKPAESVPVYIKPNERSFLARRFRETLKEYHPQLEPQTDEQRHAALKALHIDKKYKSKLVDDNGNPTHDYILSTEYRDIGKDLVKAAKEAKAL